MAHFTPVPNWSCHLGPCFLKTVLSILECLPGLSHQQISKEPWVSQMKLESRRVSRQIPPVCKAFISWWMTCLQNRINKPLHQRNMHPEVTSVQSTPLILYLLLNLTVLQEVMGIIKMNQETILKSTLWKINGHDIPDRVRPQVLMFPHYLEDDISTAGYTGNRTSWTPFLSLERAKAAGSIAKPHHLTTAQQGRHFKTNGAH